MPIEKQSWNGPIAAITATMKLARHTVLNIDEIGIASWYFFNILFTLVGPDVTSITQASNLLKARSPYPNWPPRAVIDLLVYYGVYYSPWSLRRPGWAVRIGMFNLFIAMPLYAVGCWMALINRPLSTFMVTMDAVLTLTCTLFQLSEQLRSHYSLVVLMVNLPWIIVPLAIIYRTIARPAPYKYALKTS
uniref:EXPERA domain-containing protein n=1 Tax=Spongospora subterranea TaxID=70186 RepID=A0A0H5QFT0_9EUKA|eukprot:CRZ00790.1 hypothetical protein [Spongospora subterranea]